MVRLGLIVVLAVGFIAATTSSPALCQSQEQDGSATLSPPGVFPSKDQYTVREGDQLVILVSAACLHNDGSSEFSIAEPAPEFVFLSSSYSRQDRDARTELAVLQVTPQPGDAGKYEIGVSAKACGGRVERVFTIKLRVKPEQRKP
jgi:hypothetical protein